MIGYWFCFSLVEKVRRVLLTNQFTDWNVVKQTQSKNEVIYQTRDTVFHHISNTEKKVENTTRSGVFLTNFEVFDIAMKHSDECLI